MPVFGYLLGTSFESDVLVVGITKSRSASYIIIVLIYLIAIFFGVIIYNNLEFSFWVNLLIADVIATIIVYIFSVVFKNASVYDPYWSVQPIIIVSAFAFNKSLTLLQLQFLIAIWFWGLRLTVNWTYTFKGLKHQDWRYTMLCQKTGKLYPIVNFFGIHLVPTLIVYVCTLPAVFAFQYDVNWNIGSIIFIIISICAVILQCIADCQMHSFKREKTGGLIRTGLWKYSRHPNYLGEILMWWGIALSFVSANPSYWYLTIGAVLNTLLFLFVSIPMADKNQSKKQGFNEYKKQTRMLLPIPKKI